MSKLIVNIGATANDKTGDTIRAAFDKVNANFTELYTLTGGSAADLRELAQDYAAPMFTHANHVNITAAYDDANNKILLTGSAAQVQTDWNAVSGLGVVLNKPTIPAAAVWPVTNTAGASGPREVAIGSNAGTGSYPLSTDTVAIGTNAGRASQGAYAVAFGKDAGNTVQGMQAVAIGLAAAESNQGTNAVAVGRLAGNFFQGANAVAVGNSAGATSQAANTIILNATGSAVNGVSAQTNSFYVAPIRTDATPGNILFYNTTTKEVTYGTAPAATVSSLVNGSKTVSLGTDGKLAKLDGLTLTAGGQFNICTIVTSGSGYNTGSALKATTGGSGTGMTVGIGYGLSNQLANVGVVDPGTGYVNGDVITVSGGTGGTFVITRYNELANQGNDNTVQSDWTFGVDGKLTAPGNLEVDGGRITLHPYGNAYIESVDYGVNSANSALNIFGGPYQKIKLRAGFGAEATWTFGTDGNLTLPANSTIKSDSGSLTLGAAYSTLTLPGITTITNASIKNLPTYVSGTLVGSSYTIGGHFAVGSDTHSYDGVTAISTSGLGDISSVFFTIVRAATSYVSVSTSSIGIGQGAIGSGFAVGDTITFDGATLGGTTGSNNVTVTVVTVNSTYPTTGLGYGTLIYDSTTKHIMSYNPDDPSWTQLDRQTIGRSPASTLNIGDTTTTGTINIGQNMTSGSYMNIGGSSSVSISNLSVNGLTLISPMNYVWLSLYQYYSGSLLGSTFTNRTGTATGPSHTYYGVAQLSTSGVGTGATWNVSTSFTAGPNTTVYQYVNIGSSGGNPTYGTGYAVGDTVTIAGDNLGGTNPANNLTFTIGNAVTNNYPAGLEGGMIYDYSSKHFLAYNGSTWKQLDNPLTPTGTKASNAYGVAGQTSFDSNYFYVCIANNTWRRVALGSSY
jgi:hypothetical protein